MMNEPEPLDPDEAEELFQEGERKGEKKQKTPFQTAGQKQSYKGAGAPGKRGRKVKQLHERIFRFGKGALRSCPDCASRNSRIAKACTECGRPLKKPSNQSRKVRQSKQSITDKPSSYLYKLLLFVFLGSILGILIAILVHLYNRTGEASVSTSGKVEARLETDKKHRTTRRKPGTENNASPAQPENREQGVTDDHVNTTDEVNWKILTEKKERSSDQTQKYLVTVHVQTPATKEQLKQIARQIIDRYKKNKPFHAVRVNFTRFEDRTSPPTNGWVVYSVDGQWKKAGTVSAGNYDRHKYSFPNLKAVEKRKRERRFGLSYNTRRNIYNQIMSIEHSAEKRARKMLGISENESDEKVQQVKELRKKLADDGKMMLAEEYNLSFEELKKIRSEGKEKQWPSN